MTNGRKINYDLLVAMPTEETKIFCIEGVLRSVMGMRLPDSSHMLITTGRSDPIGGEIEKILGEYGPGNFQKIIMRRLGIIRDQTIWDSEGFRPITLHRNFALRVARRFGYGELMFIDSDIETPENTYEELSRLGVDIAGGYYESRFFEERPFFGNREADGITIPKEGIDYEPGDVLQVDYTGLGCSLLSGRVIPELMFPPTVYEAEDIAFLNQALEKDMTVKVHTGIRCDHHSLFDQRIPQTERDLFSSLAWLVYSTIGNYIIRDEVIPREDMLNDPLDHVYEGYQLPTFTVAVPDGYYVFYTHPSERNSPQLRSYTFIPRDTSNIRHKIGRIYEEVPKLFSE